jgi:hypothetical protein
VRQPAGEGDHPAGDGAYPLHAGRCLARDRGRAGVEQLQVSGVAAGGVACFDVVDAAPGRVVVGVRAQAAAVILPLLAAWFQAALWFAARDAALSAAQQGVDAARAEGGTLGSGLATACQYARTAAAGILRGPACTSSGGDTITITVAGTAPAILPLFPAAVREQAQAARERFTTRTAP